MTDRTCSIEGCSSGKRIVKGMCINHYQNHRYANDIGAGRSSRVRYREANKDVAREYGAAWYARNREHRLEVGRAWASANSERVRAAQAAWHASNRERRHADAQAWRQANRENLRRLKAEWKLANPEKVREQKHRRRARMYGSGYEPVDLAALLDEYGMWCHICDDAIVSMADLHFDHVIPLARGGVHAAHNIRPAHALCNMRKGARVA